jgi:hypothetical protein
VSPNSRFTEHCVACFQQSLLLPNAHSLALFVTADDVSFPLTPGSQSSGFRHQAPDNIAEFEMTQWTANPTFSMFNVTLSNVNCQFVDGESGS